MSDAIAMAMNCGRPALRRLPATALITLLGLAALVAPARAAQTHVLDSSFTTQYESAPSTFSPVSPRSVAIDEGSGSVYVLSESPARLTKYDLEGNPSDFSLLESNTIELPEPFAQPRDLAVDNSGGINQGVIYIGRSGFSTGETALVYAPSGAFVAAINTKAISSGSAFCGTATGTSGDLFISHPSGFLIGPYIDKFHPGQWRANSTPPQSWPIAGTMIGIPSNVCKLAVDSEDSLYLLDGSATGTGTLRKFASTVFDLEEPPSRKIDSNVSQVAVDTSGDDVYSDRNSAIARYAKSGQLMEVFGQGNFEQSAGVAVDAPSGDAYVSVRRAGAVAKTEIQIYKSVTTPDIEEAEAEAGPTEATVSAQIGTAGAGDVTGCTVEYGTSAEYGETATCSPDAGTTAYSGPQPITASLGSLSKETAYHYRVTATNANGTTKDVDGTFTTHNVADLSTDAPTDVTSESATLHGSFTGNGEATSYYFQWGLAGTEYEFESAAPPGAPIGEPNGPVSVAFAIDELEVDLPESVGYHYRLVATNGQGTTYGQERTFHTLPPAPPAISGSQASVVDLEAATLSAVINPGEGPTVYSFDYGTTGDYGSSTPVAEALAGDSVDHAVSLALSGLEPATTYHFRAVAVNFGGTSYGPDVTFTTPAPPAPPSPPAPAPVRAPAPPVPPAAKPKPRHRCGGLGKRAKKNSSQARKLRHKAARAGNRHRARALRKRAAKFAAKARKLSSKAKSCRRANKRRGR